MDLLCPPIKVVIHWNAIKVSDVFMQMVNTPMLSNKFLHLKLLQISLVGMAFSGAYDYLSGA